MEHGRVILVREDFHEDGQEAGEIQCQEEVESDIKGADIPYNQKCLVYNAQWKNENTQYSSTFFYGCCIIFI